MYRNFGTGINAPQIFSYHTDTIESHPDVFIRFLTNGGEAIPKFVFISESFVECGNWGPMPIRCREVIARGKACNDVPSARQKVAAMYQEDAGQALVAKELVELINIAGTERIS